jgi:FtsP/CotA-like multicopper oxidase with cupredoxin domain
MHEHHALFATVLFAFAVCSTRAATVNIQLTISKGIAAPDCVDRNVYLINGQFAPGPTIFVNEGDWLNLTVSNAMASKSEMVSIHLHGLRQRGTPASDGAAFVSSAPISPGETRAVLTKIGDHEAGTYY